MLWALAIACFSGNVASRGMDPLVLVVAHDLQKDPTSIALLGSAYALPYALIQPVLGSIGDQLGKIRIMLVCVGILAVALLVSALATSYEVMFVSRLIAGAAAGGTFPLSIAVVGDRLPLHLRQVAIGRLLTAAVGGGLLGTVGIGVMAEFMPWRVVLLIVVLIPVAAAIMMGLSFRGEMGGTGGPIELTVIVRRFRSIFVNPRAKFCYGGAFLEGFAVFGILPFVALLLARGGETRPSIVGLVVAAFAVGGLLYTLTVSFQLRHFGQRRMMAFGGILCAIGLLALGLGPSWQLQTLCFGMLGFGIYMIHNSLQTQATELAPEARGSAVSLHSMCYFLGQAAGPVYYGTASSSLGIMPALSIGALIIILTGFGLAAVLRPVRGA